MAHDHDWPVVVAQALIAASVPSVERVNTEDPRLALPERVEVAEQRGHPRLR
jgi:hypothetical protein